jgi:hypothetical protein
MPNIEKTSRQQHHPILLWTALALSLICNAGLSITGFSTVVSVVFGVLAVLCGIGLVVHYRNR